MQQQSQEQQRQLLPGAAAQQPSSRYAQLQPLSPPLFQDAVSASFDSALTASTALTATTAGGQGPGADPSGAGLARQRRTLQVSVVPCRACA